MTDFERKLRLARKHLSANDPRLADLIARYGACGLRPHTDYYGELLSAIIGQQLSAKAGDTIYRRFIELFGGAIPTPQRIVDLEADSIRAIGVSYGKIGYMKDLAAHILDARLDLPHISTLPDAVVIDQLVAVKGIGEWSAHMFMIFSLGRLDVLPVGDLGIRRAIMLAYGTDGLPGPAAIEALAAANGWRPYTSVASWYLWKSLNNT
jgi:DNA-3-methyladenine glycosylase II